MEWTYLELGSRNKKSGNLSQYIVTVKDHVIIHCECPGRMFHRLHPCKHMKRLHEKNPILKLGL